MGLLINVAVTVVIVTMKAKGFTLIEMLVALAIGSSIALLAYQALSGSINIEERVNHVTRQTNGLQRVWQFLGDDIQHAIARPWNDYLGNTQPAMFGLLGDRQSQSSSLSIGQDSHLLRFVRSGENNFLNLQRSNLQVVGYRITLDESVEENQNAGLESEKGKIQLWRDYWRPVDSVNDPKIKTRLLLDNIKTVQFRYLPSDSKSADDQEWITGWPESTAKSEVLPIAIEVAIEVEGMGEILRIFSLIDTDY
jgi:type II secretion system protein J